MNAFLDKPICWFLCDKTAVPYRAELAGRMLVIRVNALTNYPNTSRYTLLQDAKPILDFDEWPAAWGALPQVHSAADWVALLQEPSLMTFVHDDGNENAPDDPIGRNRLVIRSDLTVWLENRKSGQVRQWSARASAETLPLLASHLTSIGFPALPMRKLVPGMSLRSVRVLVSGHFGGSVLVRSWAIEGSTVWSFCDLVDVLIAQASGFVLFEHLRDAPIMLHPLP